MTLCTGDDSRIGEAQREIMVALRKLLDAADVSLIPVQDIGILSQIGEESTVYLWWKSRSIMNAISESTAMGMIKGADSLSRMVVQAR
jgi:hypothetical protein